jgi:signal transduction histidine kinase
MAGAEPQSDTRKATFSSDSQLLSELGERLIASNKIALAELVKNAYDADASACNIWLTGDGSELVAKDDGHGMTEDEFLNNWMKIATRNRTEEPRSKKYNRPVTGSKGVGRFAVRNLGKYLELTTVARYDEDDYRELTATFDWKGFESVEGIADKTIEYQVTSASEDDVGTELRISDLDEDWDHVKLESVADEVLSITSPPYKTSGSEFQNSTDNDPGFSVYFAQPGEESTRTSAVHEIYERDVARVEITTQESTVTFDYQYSYGYDEPSRRSYTFDLSDPQIEGVSGEIRYFPNRKGVFRGMDSIDGNNARAWMSENGGVRVIDNGFQVPPYGNPGDDWLNLEQSEARRERKWRSSFAADSLPDKGLTSSDIKKRQLNIPPKRQVLGAMHISSHPSEQDESGPASTRLMADMNRQGLVENEAFDQLRDIARGALEILAIIDIEEQAKKKEREQKESENEVKEAISEAKSSVEQRDDIPEETKQELQKQYEAIEEEVEEYQERTEKREAAVESMHLLGVITGFMSHETDEMLQSAERMLAEWRRIPDVERTPEFEKRLEVTEQAVDDLQNHLGYAKRFMGALEDGSETVFPIRPRVREVIEQMERVTEPRHIETINQVPAGLDSPEVNISLYSGILLNLYSNALKAVMPISLAEGDRRVRFEAENEDGIHRLRVMDTGVGVPDGVKDRIFDPLFSTSNVEEDSPLGGGTGMGLYIIKQVLETVDGNIELMDAPDDYVTCFEVTIPNE